LAGLAAGALVLKFGGDGAAAGTGTLGAGAG
jgi:hypothetical protein